MKYIYLYVYWRGFGVRIGFCPSIPSFTITSLMKEYVNNTRIYGSNTSIHETALNPLEHSQFNTQAQITRNSALVRRVFILKFLKKPMTIPIAPNIKYNCAGVQYLLNSKLLIYNIII
jgi:hypothetical protein